MRWFNSNGRRLVRTQRKCPIAQARQGRSTNADVPTGPISTVCNKRATLHSAWAQWGKQRHTARSQRQQTQHQVGSAAPQIRRVSLTQNRVSWGTRSVSSQFIDQLNYSMRFPPLQRTAFEGRKLHCRGRFSTMHTPGDALITAEVTWLLTSWKHILLNNTTRLTWMNARFNHVKGVFLRPSGKHRNSIRRRHRLLTSKTSQTKSREDFKSLCELSWCLKVKLSGFECSHDRWQLFNFTSPPLKSYPKIEVFNEKENLRKQHRSNTVSAYLHTMNRDLQKSKRVRLWTSGQRSYWKLVKESSHSSSTADRVSIQECLDHKYPSTCTQYSIEEVASNKHKFHDDKQHFAVSCSSGERALRSVRTVDVPGWVSGGRRSEASDETRADSVLAMSAPLRSITWRAQWRHRARRMLLARAAVETSAARNKQTRQSVLRVEAVASSEQTQLLA